MTANVGHAACPHRVLARPHGAFSGLLNGQRAAVSRRPHVHVSYNFVLASIKLKRSRFSFPSRVGVVPLDSHWS